MSVYINWNQFVIAINFQHRPTDELGEMDCLYGLFELQSSEQAGGLQFLSEVPDAPEEIVAEVPKSKRKPKRKRIPHSQVEKKYRESISCKLNELQAMLPKKKRPNKSEQTKVGILNGAISYIKDLEAQVSTLQK